MKRITSLFAFVLIASALFAQFSTKVVGNNKYVEVLHKVDSYNKLIVSNIKANVIYLDEPDSAGFVKIHGEENIVNLIEVTTKKEAVTIKTKNLKSKEHGLLMIYVYSPKIESIDLTGSVIFETNDPMKRQEMNLAVTGSGQIQIHKLDCEKLKISLIGSNGDVFIAGQAKEANFSVVGDGEIRADKMLVQTASAKVIGNGNIGCNVSKMLKATITGVGDIYYRGKPEIKSTIIGTGNLKPLQ